LRSGLEQGTAFGQFLAANDLSEEDFERLIVADEMGRWACGQAGWDALDGLLDDLRMRGDYARLAVRARGKLDQQKRRSAQEKAPADGACAQAAIRWYFAERHGTTVPEDLAGHAQAAGFPDETALRKAVLREYQYECER
jgi:hypothetical protein